MSEDTNRTILRKYLKSYPDFPKKGIIFWDIFSIFKHPECAQAAKELLTGHVSEMNRSIEGFVGLEARGFLFGPILALHFGVPFIPIRKKSKLPGEVNSAMYMKEYGADVLELQQNSFKPGQKVIIVDDLIATGGSLGAAVELVSNSGGEVIECLVVIELEQLDGKSKLNVPLHSILKL